MSADRVLILGSDDVGTAYRKAIRSDLESLSLASQIIEFGPEEGEVEWYPSVAIRAGQRIQAAPGTRGILICGTGIGMAITANKVRGVRASTAHDSYSVERLVLSNDAQVLCIGSRVVGLELAKRLAREWLSYSFDPTSRSAAKVQAIVQYEQGRGGDEKRVTSWLRNEQRYEPLGSRGEG